MMQARNADEVCKRLSRLPPHSRKRAPLEREAIMLRTKQLKREVREARKQKRVESVA